MARRKKRGRRIIDWRRLSPDEEEAQRQAAFAAIRRLYSEVVAVWPSCDRGFCRRHRRCNGEVGSCLARAWPLTPPALQAAAYDQVQLGGPRRLPPATPLERELRHFPPTNFVH
jgi:hypothetical protein